MSDETTAYQKGFVVGERGDDPVVNNPYRQLTERWFDWADGWKDGKRHADNAKQRRCTP